MIQVIVSLTTHNREKYWRLTSVEDDCNYCYPVDAGFLKACNDYAEDHGVSIEEYVFCATFK